MHIHILLRFPFGRVLPMLLFITALLRLSNEPSWLGVFNPHWPSHPRPSLPHLLFWRILIWSGGSKKGASVFWPVFKALTHRSLWWPETLRVFSRLCLTRHCLGHSSGDGESHSFPCIPGLDLDAPKPSKPVLIQGHLYTLYLAFLAGIRRLRSSFRRKRKSFSFFSLCPFPSNSAWHLAQSNFSLEDPGIGSCNLPNLLWTQDRPFWLFIRCVQD